jgi:hypothetical protein
MEIPAAQFTRRRTLLLAGGSLFALTSCSPRPTATGPSAEEIAQQQRDMEAKLRAHDEEVQKALKESFAEEAAKRKALVDQERKSLTEHFEGIIKKYEEKNSALTKQLLELASKTPTTPDQQQAITEAVKPPEIPPIPPETDTDDKSEEQQQMLQALIQAILAVFFPEFAALGAFSGAASAGKSRGLSEDESQAFSRHISTGEPMSAELEQKVRKDKVLNKIATASGRVRTAARTPPFVPNGSASPKPTATPTPAPPPTRKDGAAPPVENRK